MARPRKDEDDKKMMRVTFRMTKKQADYFTELASNTQMTKSQLARIISSGMKNVYITDELISEARKISNHCAQIGNLLRLHATLIEVIDQHPSLNPQDREEIVKIRELLNNDKREIRELKSSVSALRKEIKGLTSGNI